jgi:ribosomal protein S3
MFGRSMIQKSQLFYKKYPFLKNKRTIFYKTHPSLLNKKRSLYNNLFINSTNNILNKFVMLKKNKFNIKRKIYLNKLQYKIKNNLQLLALSKVQLFVKPCETFSGIPITNATILAKLLAHLFKYHRRFYHRFLKRMFKIVKAFKIVSGLKIIFTGRTRTSARSKQFTFKYGKIPNQTLNAKIDFSFIKVLDKLGISGFKVWIYFNNN